MPAEGAELHRCPPVVADGRGVRAGPEELPEALGVPARGGEVERGVAGLWAGRGRRRTRRMIVSPTGHEWSRQTSGARPGRAQARRSGFRSVDRVHNERAARKTAGAPRRGLSSVTSSAEASEVSQELRASPPRGDPRRPAGAAQTLLAEMYELPAQDGTLFTLRLSRAVV